MVEGASSERSGYQRHEPEKTLLYRVVAEHLETFLDHARAHYDRPLPRYVERELREYLRCGIPAHGLTRAQCRDCKATIVVAFSCKRRGACPSCGARRMCNTAAHVVDRVLPDVPVRQWVLSVPFELRRLLAARADALNAISRFFYEEIARHLRRRAGLPRKAQSSAGAITFVQRFGSMNLNVHLHVLVPDGVFTRTAGEGRASLRGTPAPTAGELTAVASRVRDRMVAWLRTRELLDAYVVQPEAPAALDAFVQMTLGLGRLSELDDHGAEREAVDARRFGQRASGPHVGEADGFSVHAGVCVAAGDRAGLERLARYCARPAVSLERLSLLPDGRLAYRVKWARRGGPTHRVMTPLEFLARLAALLPPPRHPLVRFHGVFAPHSPWRSSVVPEAAATSVQGCRAAVDRAPVAAP